LPNQEVFDKFKAQYLQVGTRRKIQWYAPGSAYAGRGYDFKEIEIGACVARLHDELKSGDETRVKAATRYMLTHLKGQVS
jgi:hypothetical protein